MSTAQAKKLARQALQDALKSLDGKETAAVAAARRTAEMLDETLELLAEIRYQDWPSDGLGINLTAERLDELLIEGDAALRAASRNNLWKKPRKKTKR